MKKKFFTLNKEIDILKTTIIILFRGLWVCISPSWQQEKKPLLDYFFSNLITLNIVDPPESTIFLYKSLRTSIGQFWTTVSTVSDIGTVKSGLANWKIHKLNRYLTRIVLITRQTADRSTYTGSVVRGWGEGGRRN